MRYAKIAFVAEFAVLALNFASIRYAAVLWSADDFGKYMLIRRAVAILQLPLSCNMAVAVTRAVARRGNDADREIGALLVGALVIPLAAFVSLTSAALISPSYASTLLFGRINDSTLLPDALRATLPLIIHGVIYGYLRGRFALGWSNMLQLINLGVVPLCIVAAVGPKDPHTAFRLMTLAWTVVVIVALAALWPTLARGATMVRVRSSVKELARFGIPRVPGEFALAFIFSWPTLYVGRGGNEAAAGYVSLGTTVVTLVGATVAPLGQLVLPAASRMAARRDWAPLRRLTLWLAIGATLAAAAAAAAAWFAIRPAMLFLSMNNVIGAVPVIRLCTWASVPYVAYVVLRNILDAATALPLNAVALGIAAVAMVVTTQHTVSASPVIPFVVALSVLGMVSTAETVLVFRAATNSGKTPAY